MANQGILAQSKPAANTDTLLYSAPVDKSASTVLNVANDGTGSTFDVAVKDFDQKLVVDGSGAYLLHPGDVITGYRVKVNTPIAQDDSSFVAKALFTSTDGESTFKFEDFYTPELTTIYVKEVAIRTVTFEETSNSFVVGDTITKGTGGNTTTAVVYSVPAAQEGAVTIYIGPSTLNGTGTEFAAGDTINGTGGGTGTIAAGGVGTAGDEFIFSTTTSGGTYNLYWQEQTTLFSDRTYRFDVSDSSMTGRLFRLSTTVNGEYGPDDDITTTEGNGVEYTTGKTTNGTAGSAGAYIQYAFAGSSLSAPLYFYDGNTGSNAGAGYGGTSRYFNMATNVTFDEFYVYDVVGTWTNSTDTFTTGGVTYTVTAQTVEPYGFVRSYSGTTLYVLKGEGSADFAGSDTFQDAPKLNTASRSTVTVSSVAVATNAVEAENYIAVNHANAANNVEKLTSLVIGPGERVVVNSTTQNNVFSLIGFEDASVAFTVRAFGEQTAEGGN